MVGNHVDCRVLQRLAAEHLPEASAQLEQLDVGIQLITTRWFLCLWSSVLPSEALYRVWDFLFVCGPTAVMQAILPHSPLFALVTRGCSSVDGYQGVDGHAPINSDAYIRTSRPTFANAPSFQCTTPPPARAVCARLHAFRGPFRAGVV